MELNELNRLSDKQLLKAYYALNHWNWPKVLGDKPAGWDRLPNYRPLKGSIFHTLRYRKTKMDIAEPYLDQIALLVGRRWLKEHEGSNLSLKETYTLSETS